MMRARTILSAVIGLAALTSAAHAKDYCHFSGRFKELQRRQATLPPGPGLAVLEGFESDVSAASAEHCVDLELTHMIEARERQLVTLVSRRRTFLAGAVYRCDEVDDATKKCLGPDGDVTPLNLAGAPTYKPPGAGAPFLVLRVALPNARLIGVFTATPGLLQDGGAVTALPIVNGAIDSSALAAGDILIALFQHDRPRKFRKYVWYF